MVIMAQFQASPYSIRKRSSIMRRKGQLLHRQKSTDIHNARFAKPDSPLGSTWDSVGFCISGLLLLWVYSSTPIIFFLAWLGASWQCHGAYSQKLMMPFIDTETDFGLWVVGRGWGWWWQDTHELNLLSVWCITIYKERLVTKSSGKLC